MISDRDSQFISILWKFLCKRLSIFLWLFIVYHSQIDDQSKWVNQNIKRYLWFFCSYMQNDWFKWLLMIEFVNNNILSSVIFLIIFFMNKNFHSHMSFDSDIIKYESTRERLQIDRVKNIFKQMNKTLIFAHEALIKTQKQMMNQANKHRKKVNYKIKSKIFLNERNIITARLFKKLNDKMLDSFKITDSVDFFYKLKLLDTMHIHDVFHLDWLRRVESSRSSRVFNSSRLDSSQNSWFEYLSWVRRFNSSNWIKLKSWNWVLIRNFRFDSSRHEDK